MKEEEESTVGRCMTFILSARTVHSPYLILDADGDTLW